MSLVTKPLLTINSENLTRILKQLKSLYNFENIDENRKNYIISKVQKYGYLPYPHIKALEELTEAETLLALEEKFKLNNIYKNEKFDFHPENISPVSRAGYTNSAWINKEGHNIKLVNLAGLGNGNKTREPGKFVDWLKQLVTLPSGNIKEGVLGTTMYLIPFHPREFGCAYLPKSSEVSEKLEDAFLKEKTELDAKNQVRFFLALTQLAGHPIIYDVLPQTGRFSKTILAAPYVARWFDIKDLTVKLTEEAEKIALNLSQIHNFIFVEKVKNILQEELLGIYLPVGEDLKEIFDIFGNEMILRKKEFSKRMLSKENQEKISQKVKEKICEILEKPEKVELTEDDITKQDEIVGELIKSGLWSAPGGAWCSSGVPVFDKMSEGAGYPMFRHFDDKDKDVTNFANLDCQTPYYFVYFADCEQRLEGGGDEPSTVMPFKASNQAADCEQRLEGGGDEPSTVMPFKASNQAADCEQRLEGGGDEPSTETPFKASNQVTEYNWKVIDFYVNFLKKIQKDYNFDGFRVDHIDHIVDEVSEQDGFPISYRAPRKVLGLANNELKKEVSHFAALAEYMLWDNFFKEYHKDMAFDILWGSDIISQSSKTVSRILEDNEQLEEYNKSADIKQEKLSILKIYNNQDGEFREINQYPGQLGEAGALFKWFKYKFLCGGEHSSRPVMFIDGDESFTKTGIESVIGAEESMKRNNNYEFFEKFDAINRFALNNNVLLEGKAQIVYSNSETGFISWLVFSESSKENIFVVANQKPPTEVVRNSHGEFITVENQIIYNIETVVPEGFSVISEYVLNNEDLNFSETTKLNNLSENKLYFEKLEPSEFHFYKVINIPLQK